MKGYRSGCGMTMIELLVTMSIVAIMAAMAVPAFNKMLTNNRAQAQAGLLFRSLNYARSEAVRRSTTIKVRPLSGTDWTQGWRVWIDADGDDAFDAGEEELQHQDPLTGGPTIFTAVSVIGFLPSGYFNDGLVSGTNIFLNESTFQYALGTGNSYCTKVVHAGRVSFEKKSTCP